MQETVYQFSNPSVGTNFFTTSIAEGNNLINTQPDFNFLGASYFGINPENTNSSRVFRLFNQTTGSYFYTISETERDSLLNDNPDFVSQGEAFSAFTEEGEGREEVYRFFNPSTGNYLFTASESERQSLEADTNFEFEQVAFYTFPITGTNDTPPSEDAIIGTGEISGFVFNDRNRNGVRDSELIQGGNPDLIFVVDVSGSSEDEFTGTPVDDVNEDGLSDSILDAELAGFIGLNQRLIAQNLGSNVNVGIVVFGSSGVALNMIPGLEDPRSIEGDPRLTITPNTDNNDNGTPDVEEILSSITSGAFGAGSGTDFRDALEATQGILDERGTLSGEGNVIFLSDGDASISDDDESLVSLRNNNVNISAFGVGEGADLDSLQIIDPDAEIVTSTDEFLGALGVIEGGDGQESQSALDPLQEGVQVYLDLDNDGVLDDNEPVQETNADGEYRFTGLLPDTYTVRQIIPNGLESTAPAEAIYTVELEDDEIVGDRIFANAPVSSDNFTGAELEVEVFSPDANAPITEAVSATIGDGVEFNDLPSNAIEDANIIDVNIDVAANRITLTVDQLAPDDLGVFASTSYRFEDVSRSIDSITNVAIDPDATNSLGLTDSNLTFSDDTIQVDVSGLSYTSGSTVALNVEFDEV